MCYIVFNDILDIFHRIKTSIRPETVRHVVATRRWPYYYHKHSKIILISVNGKFYTLCPFNLLFFIQSNFHIFLRFLFFSQNYSMHDNRSLRETTYIRVWSCYLSNLCSMESYACVIYIVQQISRFCRTLYLQENEK